MPAKDMTTAQQDLESDGEETLAVPAEKSETDRQQEHEPQRTQLDENLATASESGVQEKEADSIEGQIDLTEPTEDRDVSHVGEEHDQSQGDVDLESEVARPIAEIDVEGQTPATSTMKTETEANAVPVKRAIAPSPIHIPTAEEIAVHHSAEDLHPPDSPTTSLIASLKDQLLSLSDQTHALNSKLIASISRSSDLEDEISVLKDEQVTLGIKAKSLEQERDRWEDSMKTGLLVERDQIRDEMQRLAMGLVEEERRRGSAEEKREQVENEVDDLTAKLFDQANTMVATERMSRAQAEARLKSTEENLANAESAVQIMQIQLQSLSSSAPAAPVSVTAVTSMRRKFISSHVPYFEFITFLQHLRAARPLLNHARLSSPPPALVNLLAQPFIGRMMVEDHEPTLRLEAAPALSFLSRRAVGSAIITGDLVIEPVSVSNVLQSTGSTWSDLSCSLCGKKVLGAVPQSPSPVGLFGAPINHPQRGSNSSTSRFSLKPFFNTTASTSSASAVSPSSSPLPSPSLQSSSTHTSVFIFRIARSHSTSTPSGDKDANSKVYPICRSGWCLERFRATCELWHFVRTGIIHVVWNNDDGSASSFSETEFAKHPPPPAPASESASSVPESEKEKLSAPPLPSRKKSWGIGFNKTSGGSWWGATGSPHSESKRDDDSDVGSLGAENDDVSGPAIVEAAEKARIEREADEAVTFKDEGKAGEALPRDSEDDTLEEQALSAESNSETTLPETPALARASSSASNPGSDVSFSTPKGEPVELSDTIVTGDETVEENKEDAEPEKVEPASGEGKAKAKESFIELNSPVFATDHKLESPSPSGPPPPVPRRAAARSGLYQPAPQTGDVSSLGLIEDEVKEEGQTTPISEFPPPPHHPSTAHSPPPLPPRNPHSPLAPPPRRRIPSNQTPVPEEEKREKTFLSQDADGESWEEKTWKGVVRLKENMWKARIGVVDEE